MKSILRAWSRHFLLLEGLTAFTLTLIFAVWYFYFDGLKASNDLLNGNRSAIYGAATSLFGSLLGFSITATSIALTMEDSSRLVLLKNSTHYPTLWKIFSSTIRALAYATVMSFIALVCDKESGPSKYILPIVVFVILLATLRLSRTIWAFEKMVALLTKRSH